MDGVDEIDCEPTDNLAMNNHMDLGEEHFLKLSDGGPNIDWFVGYDINHNYNFLAELHSKFKKQKQKKTWIFILIPPFLSVSHRHIEKE